MNKDIYATVAKQLRLKRLQAGLTIEKLAETANISTSFLAYLETNKKKPSLATVGKLASALNIPVSYLFDEKGISGIAGDNQKALNKILKLLHGKTPADVETILAMMATLSKKLPKCQ